MALDKLVKKLESEGWIDVKDHKQKYAKEIDELVCHIESALFIAGQKEEENKPLYDIAQTFFLIGKRFNFVERPKEEKRIYIGFINDFLELKKRNRTIQYEYLETMKWGALLGAYAGMAYSYLNGFPVMKMLDAVGTFAVCSGAIGMVAKRLAEGSPHTRGFIELKEQYTERLLRKTYGK